MSQPCDLILRTASAASSSESMQQDNCLLDHCSWGGYFQVRAKLPDTLLEATTMTHQISRRGFLGSLGIAAASVAKGGQCCCLRVRQNIACLNRCQIQSLRRGVEVMKSRDPKDPTSWQFQADIHGTLSGSDPLFNQCEHGTIQFFTWHRAYLYFFERILRAASGDPWLSLPYWNWTTHRALPEVFRLPASASNSLYDDTRSINDGSELPVEVVEDDLNSSLAHIDFWPWPAFSPDLEGSPHGAIHVLTGGNMGFVPTAANDPIFWLHHGNIDRVWDRWLNLGDGRKNPGTEDFLDKEYSFANECGDTVTIRVRDYIDSYCLGYRYDDVCSPGPVTVSEQTATPKAAPRKVLTVEEPNVIATSKAAQNDVPENVPPATRLGFSTHEVELKTVEDAGPQLQSAAAHEKRTGVALGIRRQLSSFLSASVPLRS